ncbi:MAG: 1,4-dihydroxy-2-naphthoate polyprenyltransferase [Bacteriovoracaceae bacterium]|nr:1,4-dihydroxy-2-naphthoate polyprenyltransferase [Bacteriovoracaceae bacterium]
MNKLQIWILAIRPKTLPASVGPVLLGLGIAHFVEGTLSISVAVATALCAILMQIATNLVNDYFDFKSGVDGDERLGPLRVTSQGLMAPKTVQWGYRICFILAFLCGIYLITIGGWPIATIGIFSLLFAYIYTAGPLPISHLGLGEVVALIFFGPIAVWGTYFLQVGRVDFFPLLIGLGPGLIAATIMACNNLRDIESDKKNGKKTLAVRLGEKVARILCLRLVIFSAIVPLVTYHFIQVPWILIVPLTPILFYKTWRLLLLGKIDEQFNYALARIGQYLFLYCMLFALTLNIGLR